MHTNTESCWISLDQRWKSKATAPEEEEHAAAERLKVDELGDGARVFDVAEEGHADDGVDEGDQRQQGADVEQRRQRNDQREQQLADSFGRLHNVNRPFVNRLFLFIQFWFADSIDDLRLERNGFPMGGS